MLAVENELAHPRCERGLRLVMVARHEVHCAMAPFGLRRLSRPDAMEWFAFNDQVLRVLFAMGAIVARAPSDRPPFVQHAQAFAGDSLARGTGEMTPLVETRPTLLKPHLGLRSLAKHLDVQSRTAENRIRTRHSKDVIVDRDDCDRSTRPR